MAEDVEHTFWYNLKTGEVEQGYESPSVDRVGPFETHAEAERALEILRANSAKWAEEEAAED
ncbi:MAG TPA: SPOR domain-containing protein [Agromyces sp.]|jgi:hypothetical protein